ncbi:hypothetical protein M2437_003719 [Methylorubrum pseudosasae]|nr:hypothetical protein [Methylorubrum pseudosasae]
MRLSSPMPRATSCTLAPTCSHRSAISLMKVILVARNALAAYLVSSAVRRPVNRIGAWLQVERSIDLLHHGGGAVVLGADDDAVRPLEIADGGALAQKFGVRGDADIDVGAGLANDALDLVAGADGHGRFGDDHGVAGQRLGDLAGCGIDVGQVGKAVAAAGRGADGDEHGLRLRHGGLEVGGEGEAFGPHILGDESVEAGLVDRHAALVEGGDFAGIFVDADDLVAEIGEAGARHEADIARANHRDAHRWSVSLQWRTLILKNCRGDRPPRGSAYFPMQAIRSAWPARAHPGEGEVPKGCDPFSGTRIERRAVQGLCPQDAGPQGLYWSP